MRLSLRTRAVARTALVLAGFFVWLAATAWLRNFTAPDEGRYVGVAWDMLRSGDWIVPRLDGLPFFHKPPLFYWLSASAMAVFGYSEWAARLPSMIGAMFAVGGLFVFLRRWEDAPGAKVAAGVLLTMPFFYVGAQFANLDMLVAGCLSATVLLAADATLARERGASWRWTLAGAYVFAALGILSKGLIGLVLPGAIFLVWCGATRRFRSAWLMAWLPGWVLFLAIAAPWMVAMQMRYPAFFDYFIVTQHFRRFAATGFNNAHPFWFYVPVIAVLTLPWFAWFGWLASRKGRARLERRKLSDVDWLMWIWFATVVIFFSLPRSKLVGYVLPALPPLAYLIAKVVRRAAGGINPAAHLPWRWTVALSGAMCVASVVIVARLTVPAGAELRLPASQTIAPDDQVLMLDRYYYELPFYWKLKQYVMVAGVWDAATAQVRDDWHKEFYDAAQFEPERGSKLLVDFSNIQASLCVPRTTWLIGPADAQSQYAWLSNTQLVARNERTAVWKFAGNASGNDRCLEAPRPGPASGSAPA